MDFLNKCPRDVDENNEIVTFDVISLATSIHHEFGLETIDYFLTKYQEDLHPRFRKEFVLESANFILKNNTLTFYSEFYLQIKRTAMGTVFAPTYANLTLGYHEIKVYSIISQSYALASKHFQNSLFRDLDDCHILLKVNLIKPANRLSILNKINNNIQFTMEKKSNKTTFFRYYDKQKWYKNWMDIYNKPTDSKRYAPFTSNHSVDYLTNIPFFLAKKNMCHC